MEVPLDWLREYVDVGIGEDELAERLTMLGLEVEDVARGPHGTIFSIYVTPNRGDCMSIRGVARETAALLSGPLKTRDYSPPEGSQPAAEAVTIEIVDRDLCPRYCGRVVEGVKVGPSPAWMQGRIEAYGLRPVNNVVDVTNYVLIELGQPLHAFDLDKLSGQQITVRRARPGEKITTIDGDERELSDPMLVIADERKPVAVAGVMGGHETEVSGQTTRVLLESAVFDPASVRQTSKRLGLISDSSVRFERRIDPETTPVAIDMAAKLIAETAGGVVRSGIVDVNYIDPSHAEIEVRPERVNKILGLALPKEDIADALRRLQLVVTGEGPFSVAVPSFRPDIECEADLIEEVARIVGYDEIPTTLPAAPSSVGKKLFDGVVDRAEEVLRGLGFSEIHSHSLTSQAETIGPAAAWPDPLVCIRNPMSQDQSHVRDSLLPGLVKIAISSASHGLRAIRAFDSGWVHKPIGPPDSGQVDSTKSLAGLVCGPAWELDWSGSGGDGSGGFYHAKGVLEALFRSIGLPGASFEPGGGRFMNPGRSALIEASGEAIGAVGELSAEVADELMARGNVSVFEVDMGKIESLARKGAAYAPPPRYPAVERDLCVVVDRAIKNSELVSLIEESGGDLLESVSLFDVFSGDQVGSGCMSLAYSLRFRSPDRTLTDDEVDGTLERIRDRLAEGAQASFRDS